MAGSDMTASRPAPELALRKKDVTLFDRDDKDFYPEPYWPVEQLCKALNWEGRVWDPACGYGTIPQVFLAAGHIVTATDLVDRGYGLSGQNFLAYKRELIARTENIVCNPPFKLAIEFLRQAKRFTTKRVAFLLPLKWLASDTRLQLFKTEWKPAKIFVLSNRLSMPPGVFIDPETRRFNCDDPNPKKQNDGTLKYRWRKGDMPKGGAVDFCWVVWEHGHDGPTETFWMSKEMML